MNFSIASYSFHRALEAGQQDMFRYIADSKALDMAQLDPWNGHLAPITQEDEALRAGDNYKSLSFSPETQAYIGQVRAAADAAGLSFGCVAVDGAHIYEDTADKRERNRYSAYRWLDVAHTLGARQIRIDSGGTPELPDGMFRIIVEGYRDIVARAKEKSLEVVIENHWGSSKPVENVMRFLDAVPDVKLLMDSHNWRPDEREIGWQRGAPYTTAVHVKTFEFDENGDDPSANLDRFVQIMVNAGYTGCWGIESVPRDGDEYGAVRKTRALLERLLRQSQRAGQV